MMPSGLPSSPSPKYLSAASPQPLKSPSMVQSCSGAGNGSAGSLAPWTSPISTPSTTGRKPGLGVVGLRLRAGHELQERLGGVAGVGGDGRGVLDEQGVRRQDVVDLGAVLLGQDRLVLVGQQDVAAAVGEGGGRLTTAAREGDGVVEQLGDVGLGVVLAATVAGDVGPGREDVPPRRAGRAGVRGDDLDARLDQVVPGLDALGVARGAPRRRRPRRWRCRWWRCPSSPRRPGPRRPGGSRRSRASSARRRRRRRPRPRGSGRRRRRRTSRR